MFTCLCLLVRIYPYSQETINVISFNDEYCFLLFLAVIFIKTKANTCCRKSSKQSHPQKTATLLEMTRFGILVIKSIDRQ